MDEHFYKKLLDNLSDGVYFVDRERKITYWNKGSEKITGYTRSEVTGTCCYDNILSHVNNEGKPLCLDGKCPLAKTIEDGKLREAELFFRHKDGHRVPILVKIAPIKSSHGRIIGAVEVFSDNSFKTFAFEMIEQLKKESLVDYLTGLVNRRYLEMTLHTRLSELRRYGWPFGILFIDIDNFKGINDKFGHDVGDKFLAMISRTLLSNTRSFDSVGRWGGEEFIITVTNVNALDLFKMADRYRILIQSSSLSNGSENIKTTVSIGATLARSDETPETLVQRADKLMYKSKNSGRNRVSMD